MVVSSSSFTTLVSGLAFPESPRWHQGQLWFVEKRGGAVRCGPESGPFDPVLTVAAGPGGIDWTPDGDLLVVATSTRQLLRWTGSELVEVADLSEHTRGRCNDLVVGAGGDAYVGHFGYDLLGGEAAAPASLVLVRADGSVEVVAEDLAFPNGAVITSDGSTLVVAESAVMRLTAFTIGADGRLTDRRTFADLGDVVPDGICLDAEGAIWVSDPIGRQVVRVADGGEVTTTISTGPMGAFACALGGDDGRSLFVCLYSEIASQGTAGAAIGSVVVTSVDVAAAPIERSP